MAKIKPFTVIFEDAAIIAVNKASGIAVTGERWDEEAPRLDLLLKNQLYVQGNNAETELFTVHRIDKETSGLVVFAKDRETHRRLSAAFEKREVEKTYTAVVHGRPFWPGGKTSCDLCLVPDGNKNHLTIIDQYQGKPSCTGFTLLFSAGNYSVVEAFPQTGRTHQIRVHLSAMGFPIVCDPLYGKQTRKSGGRRGIYLSSFKRNWQGDETEERPLLDRLGLHAARLVFGSTANIGGVTSLEAPLPRDMAALIKQMEKCRS